MPLPNDEFEAQLGALGYTQGYPARAIRGVHLTDAQYDDYVRISGRLVKMQLETLLSHPQWPSIPDASKLSIVKAIAGKAKDTAQTAIMLRSQGGENDIVQKATDAKLAQMAAQEGLQSKEGPSI